MARLRMCEADRQRYGGPEWLGFDLGRLTQDTPGAELEEIEESTGTVLVNAVRNPAAARAVRLWLWLGLRAAGVTLAWDEFAPRTLLVDWESGDVDPPAPSTAPSTDPSATG